MINKVLIMILVMNEGMGKLAGESERLTDTSWRLKQSSIW